MNLILLYGFSFISKAIYVNGPEFLLQLFHNIPQQALSLFCVTTLQQELCLVWWHVNLS